jgi:hypothetical protein
MTGLRALKKTVKRKISKGKGKGEKKAKKSVSCKVPCGVCSMECSHNVVCCDGCDIWFHTDCIHVENLDELPDEWFCNTCKDEMENIHLVFLPVISCEIQFCLLFCHLLLFSY